MQPLLGQTMMALADQDGGGPRKLDEVPFLPLAERATRETVHTARRGRNENASVMRFMRVVRTPRKPHAQTGAASEGSGWALLYSLGRSGAA